MIDGGGKWIKVELVQSGSRLQVTTLQRHQAFNVSKLEGCGMGRQSSIPFVTTVEDLQKNIVI